MATATNVYITAVNSTPVSSSITSGKFIRSINATIASSGTRKGLLNVSGTADVQGATICCTLVRLGKTVDETRETISPVLRFAVSGPTSTAPNWTVVFNVSDAGTYLVVCHSGKDTANRNANDYLEVKVAFGTQLRGILEPTLTLNPPNPATATTIGASGTVFYANNLVTCTLTPINDNDGTTNVTGVTMGSSPSQIPSTVTFDTTGYNWTATFNGTFSGSYVLEATAGNEGSVATTITI